MRPFRARHARGDRGEYEDAFKSFAENENADVQKRDGRTGVRLRRVGRAMRGDALPEDHREHDDRRGKNTDAQRRFHYQKVITSLRRPLPLGCAFLAAGCAGLRAVFASLPKRVVAAVEIARLQHRPIGIFPNRGKRTGFAAPQGAMLVGEPGLSVGTRRGRYRQNMFSGAHDRFVSLVASERRELNAIDVHVEINERAKVCRSPDVQTGIPIQRHGIHRLVAAGFDRCGACNKATDDRNQEECGWLGVGGFHSGRSFHLEVN
jgi:hypothetical protein